MTLPLHVFCSNYHALRTKPRVGFVSTEHLGLQLVPAVMKCSAGFSSAGAELLAGVACLTNYWKLHPEDQGVGKCWELLGSAAMLLTVNSSSGAQTAP